MIPGGSLKGDFASWDDANSHPLQVFGPRFLQGQLLFPFWAEFVTSIRAFALSEGLDVCTPFRPRKEI